MRFSFATLSLSVAPLPAAMVFAISTSSPGDALSSSMFRFQPWNSSSATSRPAALNFNRAKRFSTPWLEERPAIATAEGVLPRRVYELVSGGSRCVAESEGLRGEATSE
jgi:hypothetical protein